MTAAVGAAPAPAPTVAVVHRHLAVSQALALQVRRILRHADLVVAVTSTGQLAWPRTTPALLLLDERLPGRPPVGASEAVEAAGQTRVVMLLDSALACAACTARWHLPLDASAEELAQVLRAVWAGRAQPALQCCRSAAGAADRDGATEPGSAAPPSVLTSLTPREREILLCLSQGMHSADIARELFVSVNTVRSHRRHLLAKLGVHSALEAATVARDAGIRRQQGLAGPAAAAEDAEDP